MDTVTRDAKLVQLRSKTDRDLVILLQRELDRGLALANVAASKRSPLYAQAEGVHETVKVLLPKIAGLSGDERRELELRLNELQSALDPLNFGKTRRYMGGASVE